MINTPIGSQVEIIGPFGSSYVPKAEQKHIVMIAGGVGVAPFLSILRSTDSMEYTSRFTLITVNSSAETAVFQKELQELSGRDGCTCISHLGSLTNEVLPSTIDFRFDTFYICGPSGMVDSVCELLKQRGVPFGNMHFEQHYPADFGNLTTNDFLPKQYEKNIMLQAVQDSKNHVIITDANGQIIFANKTAERNTGFTFEEMKGNTPRLWGGLMSAEFYQKLWIKKQEAGDLMVKLSIEERMARSTMCLPTSPQ
jgi:ferredoxin-NADP reductase